MSYQASSYVIFGRNYILLLEAIYYPQQLTNSTLLALKNCYIIIEISIKKHKECIFDS